MTAEQIMIEQIMLENQEIGRIKGREEARKKGREEGIRGMIAFSKKNDISELDFIEAVVSSMGMSEEEARMIVKKYW
ncbi:MAG: hypothetical protein IJL75_06585 [Eubacterium sp.]|nr:hypothetical protein [Eubacterium sp.]